MTRTTRARPRTDDEARGRPAAPRDEGTTVNDTAKDPVIQQLRDQISDNDLKILDGVNKRLKLVAQLWEYKRSKGLDVLSPGQEEWLLTFASRANKGPLTSEGLREIYRAVLDLTKRELDGRK
jgi:chorismate mutase